MGLRVLIIDDDPVFRRLLAHHVAAVVEAPAIAEHDPASAGRLPATFRASDYDVVLLDDQPGAGTGVEWLEDLRGRPGFPPVIYLLSQTSPEAESVAGEAGAFACLSRRKIDPRRLAGALRAAEAEAQVRRDAPPVIMPDFTPEPAPEPPPPPVPEFTLEPAPQPPLPAVPAPAGLVAPAAGDDAQSGSAPVPAAGSEAVDEACRFGNLVLRGYRQVRKLAESPNSTVYLADDQRSGQRVVLKVLNHVAEAGSKSGDAFSRFLREYDIASSIDHPNIVKIHDFGAGDDYAYIAMEYFPEGDLRSRIKGGLTPLQAAALARQMAEALQALHSAGVLHRDLKPGNVMLRGDGSIALIDFGMSKQLQLEAGLTGNGEIFGTPYYMSPEQGHGRATDERSDLYSLGIILYEMLMRRKPYVAGTPMQVIYKHANSPLPELTAGLKRFEPILYNCIAKDPDRRYPSAEALAAALRDAESDAADSEAMGY